MSYLFDSAPQGLTGYHFGRSGLGVTGAEIRANTSTGDHGPGYLYNDWDSGDDAKEFQGLIVTPPTGGTWFAYEDGSFTFASAPDGSYPFEYRLYVDGVDLGLQSSTITVGVPGIVGTSAITLGSVATAAAGTVHDPASSALPRFTLSAGARSLSVSASQRTFTVTAKPRRTRILS